MVHRELILWTIGMHQQLPLFAESATWNNEGET